MNTDIFEKRINYKPFEYPEILTFVDAVNQTYWVHNEVTFTADEQDFRISLNDAERSAIKNSLLAIAQIEVAVKSFWANVYNYLPKPELNGLGSTFSECEFRHSEAYSRLLTVLGMESEFEKIMEIPEIKGRVEFLSSYLDKVEKHDKKGYATALIIFSLFIENVSLFSQFAIMLSFTHFKGLLKNTSNIIAWTSKDEQIHAAAGIFLFNQIIKENPHLMDKEFENLIYEAAKKSIKVETRILDWIFEKGEISTISKQDLVYFMQNRVNESLEQIKLKPCFDVPKDAIQRTNWFNEEIIANTLDDFFAKRPVEYTKHNVTISEESLF
jgi:ribonucleoside-diphosphate reductase beta chain